MWEIIHELNNKPIHNLNIDLVKFLECLGTDRDGGLPIESSPY